MEVSTDLWQKRGGACTYRGDERRHTRASGVWHVVPALSAHPAAPSALFYNRQVALERNGMNVCEYDEGQGAG